MIKLTQTDILEIVIGYTIDYAKFQITDNAHTFSNLLDWQTDTLPNNGETKFILCSASRQLQTKIRANHILNNFHYSLFIFSGHVNRNLLVCM